MNPTEPKREPEDRASGSREAPEIRPRNWLEPMILVALREYNSYGYELMKRTAEFGFGAMNPGTLYRTLRNMEKNGVVKSRWETSSGGPARRNYAITRAGEAYLDLWAQSLKGYQRIVDAFLQTYVGQGRPHGPERGQE